jgi:dTMP kinase
MHQSPRFISLEGIDGAGKSTVLRRMEAFLKEQHYAHIVTREPGGCVLGERLRTLLLEPGNGLSSPLSELLLMWAARVEHVTQVIKPALEKGLWVLSDRYCDATMAYQGGGRYLPLDLLEEFENIMARLGKEKRFLYPHYTFYLDISLEESLKRQGTRGQKSDRFEKEKNTFFERVRAVYQERVRQDPQRMISIHAEGSEEEVWLSVKRYLQTIMQEA